MRPGHWTCADSLGRDGALILLFREGSEKARVQKSPDGMSLTQLRLSEAIPVLVVVTERGTPQELERAIAFGPAILQL